MESDLFEKETDYVLVEESSTDELQTPLKRSSRLKYNCLSVSNKLVAIGSNTGGIYVFSRSDQKLLQIAFAEKETGSVSSVKISPHEKYVAFISSNNVHVLDLRLESRSKAETLKSSNPLTGCTVSCLQWDRSSTKLYVGDDLGNVSMMSVSSSKTKNIFSLPLEVIMKLDSVIVQIDNVEDKVLVSTLTRCYLCQTTKQQYSQIGQRLRDGNYGACFLQQATSAPMIYCARPGSRIWEVDFEGTVLNTHQFKQLLSVPPRKIVNMDSNYQQFVSNDSFPAQAVAFPKLTVLRSRYLLTWTGNSIYVLDPINVRVILWTNQFSDIQDVCCADCSIYIFFKSMKIECVTFLPVTSVLPLYLKLNNLEAAANMCVSHRLMFAHKLVRKRFGVTEMSRLYDELVTSDMSDLAVLIKDVIDDVEEKMAAETELENSGFVRSSSYNPMGEKNLLENGTALSSGAEEAENCLSNAQESLSENGIENLDKEKVVDTQYAHTEDDNSVVKDITQNTDVNHIPEVTVNELNAVQTNLPEMITITGDTCKLDNEQNVVENTDKSEQLNDTVKLTDKNEDQYVEVETTKDNKHDVSNNDNDGSTVSVNENIDNGDSEGIPSELKSELNAEPRVTNLPMSKLTIPHTSLRSVSPVSMDTSDDLLLEDEDDVGYLPRKGMGPRRLSSTSLSSLSSAEVFLEPAHSFENESTDPIAMPVKRRFARKKSRRKSAIETPSAVNVAVKRSLSSGSMRSKSSSKDLAMSPQGSVHSLKEEDSISVYSNDSVTMEDATVAMVITGTKDEDIPDGIIDIKSPETIPGSPVSYSEELYHSEEFSKSGDYLQSGEFSPGEISLSQSGERNKQGPIMSSSAPKAALMQFKNKMQNKVSTKTKGLIRNIKEKNLLSKAKEIAGNLSQGSEAYLYSGEIPFNENPSLQMPPVDVEGGVKNVNDSLEDHQEDVSKVTIDLSDLQEITARTVEMLEDIAIICDTEAVEGVLVEWIKVLNTAFQAFHVEKYRLNKNDTPRDEVNEMESRDGSSAGNIGRSAANKLDNGETVNTNANHVALETDKRTGSLDLSDKEKHTGKHIDEIANMLKGPNFCYIKDPLHLPEDLLCQVCDLVQACFDIRCHGNLLMYINFDQNESKVCDKTSTHPIVCDNTQCDVSSENNVKCEEIVTDVKCESEKDVKCEQKKDIKCENETDVKCESEKDVKCESDRDVNCEVTSLNSKSSENTLSCSTDNSLPPDTSVHTESYNNSRSSDNVMNGEKSKVPDGVDEHSTDCYKSGRELEGDSKGTSTECAGSIDNNVSLDYVMGLFVRCYFPYLGVSRVRETFRTAENCYHVWSALTTCMEEKCSFDAEKFGVEEKSVISYMIENQAQFDEGASLLGHISKMFRNKHGSIADVCVRCHPYIQPLDVMYLCRYHLVTMETIYKQYMHWMTVRVSSATRKHVLNYLSQHTEPALVWLDILLSEDDFSSKVHDEDGCPRCMSHTVPWKYNSIINEFVDLVVQEDVRRRLIELFRKYGYWVGVLKIMKTSGNRQEHLKLVLQLADVHLLGEDNALGYQPESAEDWEKVLTMFSQLSSDAENQPSESVASDWSNLITWDNLAILLVKHVGSEKTVSMLERHNVPEQVLSTHFYQTCILSGMVQKQQRLILHSMLEKVDTYLWSQRPTALNPQMQYLAVTEKKTSGSESADGHSDILPNMVNHIQKQNLDLYVEDPECHWGIENKINMLCRCCFTALRDIVSHEEPGVLVFKCGHSFHKFCLPGKECCLCSDKK